MPTYVANCSTCGTDYDYVRSIANRNDTPECCGAPTVKSLTAPAISAMAFTGHKGFHMPDGKQGGKGTWIESGQDYKKYLRENNKIPTSEAASEAKLQKKNAEAADNKKRREAVIKAVNTLAK
jgi:predicted nucleic acid-binding Zn ribbon protein